MTASESSESKCPVSGTTGGAWYCPWVKTDKTEEKKDDGNKQPTSECPMKEEGSSCPVNKSGGANPFKGPMSIGLAPGSKLKDSNTNPDTPNLSTETMVSSIPKAGSENENWVYPSDQRWYNAVKKKEEDPKLGFDPDKSLSVTEDAVPTAVYIHNMLNEQAWKEILNYESLHKGSNPKLKSFRGRAGENTPKSIFMNLLGYAPLPFDRHDWVVESNGVHRKYVIDYYADEDDDSGIPNIYLDVRPCILSFSGIIDRIKMNFTTINNEQSTRTI